ncbi:MAG: hypothetical protein Q9191_000598 [Dirinaria sp. TL-2023a]
MAPSRGDDSTPPLSVSSIDFAAAQQRIRARQQASVDAASTRLAVAREARTRTLSRLPYPLSLLGGRSLDIWSFVAGREGTRPYFRVGQVDAELLDEELLELLKGQVGDGLKYFGSHLRDEWAAEILLGLRLVLWKLSVWDHDASYGAALQNLKYIDARHQGPVPRAPSRWQKGLYGLVTVGGRYAWVKWEDWLAEQEGGYEEPSANFRLFSRMTSLVSTTHSIAAFASFLVFLVNGRYRTLMDRLLRLRLATPVNHVSREVSFEYLNRQLVWHAFTEFLLFLLPLVGISRWRRWFSRAWRRAKGLVKSSSEDEEAERKGELAFLPERTCAICYKDQNPASTSESEILAVSGSTGGVIGSAQTDVTNPYETIPCGCIYCFVCIATRLEAEEGEGWTCLRCWKVVKECKPWSGDVIEEIPQPKSSKKVSFSDEELESEKSEPSSGAERSQDSAQGLGKAGKRTFDEFKESHRRAQAGWELPHHAEQEVS